jgi:sugar phosphate permease
MFIIVSIMTFAVAVAGFFIWPGTPDKPNHFVLSQEELDAARKRLADIDNDAAESNAALKITRAFLKRVLTSWKLWVLSSWTLFFWNSDPQPWGGYLLWIKSLGRFSDAEVNRIGSSAPALGILYVLVINFSSDLWLGRPTAIVIAHMVNILSMAFSLLGGCQRVHCGLPSTFTTLPLA